MRKSKNMEDDDETKVVAPTDKIDGGIDEESSPSDDDDSSSSSSSAATTTTNAIDDLAPDDEEGAKVSLFFSREKHTILCRVLHCVRRQRAMTSSQFNALLPKYIVVVVV